MELHLEDEFENQNNVPKDVFHATIFSEIQGRSHLLGLNLKHIFNAFIENMDAIHIHLIRVQFRSATQLGQN